MILLYCFFLKKENELIPSHPPLHSTPISQRERKLAVCFAWQFPRFSNVNLASSQNYTLHDNMYIVPTAFKWFRNCSVIFWSSSKVDLRHLGMSLVILRAVIVPRNEWSWICLQSNNFIIYFFVHDYLSRRVFVGKVYLRSSTLFWASARF